MLSSGSPLSPWYFTNDSFTATRRIVSILHCFNNEPRVVLECLQDKSTLEILEAYEDFTQVDFKRG